MIWAVKFVAEWLIFHNPNMLQEKAEKIAKIVLIITVIVSLVGGIGLYLHVVKAKAVDDYKAKVEHKTTGAKEKAADQRVLDALDNAKTEGELHAAIDQAVSAVEAKGESKGELSVPAHALACKRLLNHGRIPPSCRSEGTSGTETSSK